ncbi:MAG: isoprenylcysteine carboxylmethyltransferase family protein [Promethearchaeota archaeon]
MSDELLFRILFIVLWVILAAIRIGYGRKGKREQKNRGEGEQRWANMTRSEKGALVVLSADILLFIVTSIFYVAGLPWMMLFQVLLPDCMRWLGVGIASISLPLLWWVHHILGRHWSRTLEIKGKHELCMEGPYSRVRHPMYSVFFIFMMGMGLISANFLLFIFFAIFVAFMYTLLIPSEERMMLDHFGEEYQNYMQRTGRIFPRILYKVKEKRAPESQEVEPSNESDG